MARGLEGVGVQHHQRVFCFYALEGVVEQEQPGEVFGVCQEDGPDWWLWGVSRVFDGSRQLEGLRAWLEDFGS